MPGIWGFAQEDMLCSWVLVLLAIVSSHMLQHLAELFLTLDIILYVCICPSSIDDVYPNEITLNMVFTCASLVGGSELGPTQNSTPMTLFSDTRRAFCTCLFMFGKCEPNKMLLSRTRIQPRDAREMPARLDWSTGACQHGINHYQMPRCACVFSVQRLCLLRSPSERWPVLDTLSYTVDQWIHIAWSYTPYGHRDYNNIDANHGLALKSECAFEYNITETILKR